MPNNHQQTQKQTATALHFIFFFYIPLLCFLCVTVVTVVTALFYKGKIGNNYLLPTCYRCYRLDS